MFKPYSCSYIKRNYYFETRRICCSPGWARGFSIGAGALAIAISFLVMASPFAGAVFVSVFLGIALLIIGIEIIVVGVTGRRMQMMPSMGR